MKNFQTLLMAALMTAITFISTAEAAEMRNMMGRMFAPPPEIKLQVGEKITDFKINDLAGNVIDTEKIRKNRIFIIRFTAMNDELWEKETQSLNQISGTLLAKVAIMDVVIPPVGHDKAIEQYENAHAAFTVTVDKDEAALKHFGIDKSEIPVAIVFDENGALITVGRTIPPDLCEKLDKMIKERELEK